MRGFVTYCVSAICLGLGLYALSCEAIVAAWAFVVAAVMVGVRA